MCWSVASMTTNNLEMFVFQMTNVLEDSAKEEHSIHLEMILPLSSKRDKYSKSSV